MPLDQAQWQIDILAADKTAAAFASVGRRMRDMERAFSAGARSHASQVQSIVDGVVRSTTDPTAIVQRQAAGYAALAASSTLLGRVNAQAIQQFGTLRVATDAGSRSMVGFSAGAAAAAGGGGSLLAMLGRLSPILGLVAIASATWQAGMKSGALVDQAEQIGLTVEQLQAYRFAAMQVGVTNDQLDSSVLSLTRAMGAANGGSDEMIAKFTKLGVKLLDNRGELRSVASVMPEVARGLLGIGSETERSALSMELFDKSGARMLTLLGDVARGSDAVVESARKQQVVVGVDVAQAWNKLDTQLKIVTVTVDAALAALGAPIATWALEKVDWLLKEILGNLDRIRKLEAQAPAIAVGADIKNLQDQLAVQENLLKINPNNFAAKASANALRRRIEEAKMVQTQIQASQDMETLNRGKLPVSEPPPGKTGSAGSRQPIGDAARKAGASAAEALAKRQLEDSRKLLDQMLDDIERVRKAAEGVFDKYGPGAHEAARKTAELNEMLQLGYLDVDTYAHALRDVTRAADDQNRAFIGAKGGFDAYVAGFDQGIADLARANTEFEIGRKAVDLLSESIDILAGVSNKSFAQVALDFAIMVAKMEAARAGSQVWSAIGGLSGIGGLISSAFSAIVGGVTAGTGAGGVMDGSYGGSLTYGGPRAAGGPVSPGSWYMVGEEGPEPFVPGTSGHILPNRSLRGGGGGDTINIYQTVRVGEFVTTTEYRRGLADVRRSAVDGAQQGLIERRRHADPSVKGVF